jgi:hypothetical protein
VTIIMTASPAGPPADSGKVLQLRAVDAQTEVRLDEAKPEAPSYVDLTSGDGQRRAIIPEHWRTWDNARRHVSLAAARHVHRGAYHGVRSPGYLGKSGWKGPIDRKGDAVMTETDNKGNPKPLFGDGKKKGE